MIKSSRQKSMYTEILDNDHAVHVQAMIDHDDAGDRLEVVLPKPNQIQIDYDTPEIPNRFSIALELLLEAYCERGDGVTYHETESKSGNRHVCIDLPVDIDATTRVAWQAVFGSDLTREGLSLVSIQRGLENPSLMIEVKNRPYSAVSKVRS